MLYDIPPVCPQHEQSYRPQGKVSSVLNKSSRVKVKKKKSLACVIQESHERLSTFSRLHKQRSLKFLRRWSYWLATRPVPPPSSSLSRPAGHSGCVKLCPKMTTAGVQNSELLSFFFFSKRSKWMMRNTVCVVTSQSDGAKKVASGGNPSIPPVHGKQLCASCLCARTCTSGSPCTSCVWTAGSGSQNAFTWRCFLGCLLREESFF